MPEYGLDCQSRHSKSCVVNDGSLSTKVLRVAVGYRGTRSKVFRFLFRRRYTSINSSAAASMTEFREVKSTAEDLRVGLEVKAQLTKIEFTQTLK